VDTTKSTGLLQQTESGSDVQVQLTQ